MFLAIVLGLGHRIKSDQCFWGIFECSFLTCLLISFFAELEKAELVRILTDFLFFFLQSIIFLRTEV